MMTTKEILSRFTGFSSPIGGLQWDPPKPSVAIAKDVIKELEDRRVLYNPMHMEDANHCVQSVRDMRNLLTISLKELKYGSPLDKQIRRMRRASRRFMDRVGHTGFQSFSIPVRDSILHRELNRLREKFGEAIAEISISYGIDVEDDLAAVIPFNNLRN